VLASRNAETVRSLIIETRIERDGRTLFAGEIALSELRNPMRACQDAFQRRR
jgi:hypothetical protein